MPKKPQPKPISLNPEQQAVVGARDGVWSVSAGPGAGKSTVLLLRHVSLIKEGYAADEILGLTFTAASAKSLRDRAEELLPETDTPTRVSRFVTFHSLCLSICTKERDRFGFDLADFPLASEGQTCKLVGVLAKKFELDWKSLGTWISARKREGIRPSAALKTAESEGSQEKYALAYKSFDSELKKLKLLDFDSMVMEVVSLLERDENVRNRWQFTDIMVDEAQDCDAVQYKITQLLSNRSGNIMFIGDSSQSCYGFRGARSDIFRNLSEIFPQVQTLYLGQNFRSTPEIVGFVKSLSTDTKLAEHFHTTNLPGPSPKIIGFPSSTDQAQYVVGLADSDGVCLSRTNRGLSDIENALSVAGVKYKLLGKCGFWAQAEIKFFLGYLQCAVFPSDSAVLTALRAPFHPANYIKKTELVAKIKTKPEDQTLMQYLSRQPEERVRSFVHFLDSLRRYRDVPPSQAIASINRDLRCLDYYAEEQDPDNSPIENLSQLAVVAKKFGSVKDFLDFARKVAAASRSRKAFTLSTIHGAKGLQWPRVIVTSVNDGVLPHSKGDMEEERNLYFIACSRPERELHICYHGLPSPFLVNNLKENETNDLSCLFD